MKNTMTTTKIFKLICNDFGHKFSFNAQSLTDAISKAKGYCRYHSFSFESEFKVEETTDKKWMHNEYVN